MENDIISDALVTEQMVSVVDYKVHGYSNGLFNELNFQFHVKLDVCS